MKSKQTAEERNRVEQYPFTEFDKPFLCPKNCGTLLRKASMMGNMTFRVSQIDPNSILSNREHKCAKDRRK